MVVPDAPAPFVVTAAAAAALEAIVASTGRGEPARVRLVGDVTAGGRPRFALTLVDVAEHDDIVLRTARVPLFIERVNAPLLAGLVLDRCVDADAGGFVLTGRE